MHFEPASGCEHWVYDGSITMKVACLINSENTMELTKKLNDDSKKTLYAQSISEVRKLEATCHDIYRDIIYTLVFGECIWGLDDVRFLHDQTYVSIEPVIPNLLEEYKKNVIMSEKCDILILREHKTLKGKFNLCFSLELKRCAKTGEKKSDVPQMKRYLKNAMRLWRKPHAYGALADFNEITFFKMVKEDNKYKTYSSRMYHFPTGGKYNDDMKKALCYFITLAEKDMY